MAVKFHDVPYGTKEWLEWRQRGIGGSEISILFGFMDKYSSPAKLYNLKIGRIEPDAYDNEAMAWGRWLESTILNRWQFYDGSVSYLENYRENKVIRRFKQNEGFAVNDLWPWLFYSEDGHFEDGVSLITGEVIKKGLLECKTITTQSAARWEHGIPPGYLYQVHQGMLIHELDYAEIVVLKDGRFLSVYPVERSNMICNQIVNYSKDFWYNRVVPGREAYEQFLIHEKMGKTSMSGDYLFKVDDLEPMPDGSDGHKDFENQRWNETAEKQLGDEKNWNRLVLDKKFLETLNALKKMREQNIQMVRRDMRIAKVDSLEYDKNGYVRIYQRKGANSPQVDNRIKVKVDESAVERGIKRLIKILNGSE